MRDHRDRMIHEIKRKKREKSVWRKVVTVLASVVVFCTTYALILPAITMEAQKTMVCTEETASSHVHGAGCQAPDGTNACGYADYVIHTHEKSCYDAEGNLICALTEVKEHTHTDACYQEVQVQAEDRAEQTTEKELICDKPEVIFHEHTDACLDEAGNRICNMQQVLRHEHTDACYVAEQEEEQQTKEEEKQQLTAEEQQPEEKQEAAAEMQQPEEKQEPGAGEQQSEEEIKAEENQKEENISETDKTQPIKEEEQQAEQNQRKHKMTYKGEDYTIRVTYGEEAGLPENVELKVEEIENTEYETYYAQAEAALPEDQSLLFCRFFDVSFLKDGEKVEPKASVEVEISYTESIPQEEGVETSAVHFAEEGIEVIPAEVQQNSQGEDTFVFTQDSFSVVGTVVTVINQEEESYIFYRDGNAPDAVDISILKINDDANPEALAGTDPNISR